MASEISEETPPRRKLIVEIELVDDDEDFVPAEEIEFHFRYLMADAISEFYRSRGFGSDHARDNKDSVADYVEDRYGDHDDVFKAKKRKNVMMRCRVARAMHQGFLSPKSLVITEDSGPSSLYPIIIKHDDAGGGVSGFDDMSCYVILVPEDSTVLEASKEIRSALDEFPDSPVWCSAHNEALRAMVENEVKARGRVLMDEEPLTL